MVERTSSTPLVCTIRDPARLAYTDRIGTTGLPKGVDVSHQGVVNALSLQPSCLDIKVGSKVAQILSISFDMGEWLIAKYSRDFGLILTTI
jgi:acyl-coenzyme A synthetase/AMP-(fatty) acid ligase